MSSYDPYHPALPPADPADLNAARERVQVPAVFLIIVGVLNLFVALALGGIGSGAHAMRAQQLDDEMGRRHPEMWEGMKKQGYDAENMRSYAMRVYFATAAVTGLAGLLIILGAARMLVLRSYPLAVFAAILSAIPCISPAGCCMMGEAAGVWALFVLLDTEVSAAFL
jgi:hypothetical protein